MSTANVLGKGRTALVTGASRGIGPLIARQIASYGGHVVLTGRSAADLKAVASDLAASGADVSFIPCDLTEPGAAEALVKEVERQHDGIDLLVNNAGGDPLREFHAMTIDENLRTLQLNLIAPLALSHAALDGMLLRGRGHIVNISAMAGRLSFPYTEIYAAAKHEPFVVPLYALIAAPSAGFLIGAVAGLYPAAKAARLSPTEALRA